MSSIEKNKTRDLILNQNLYRVIFLIAFPIMISNVIQALYDLIDMFYVGYLGAIPIAALSLVSPINFFILAIATGTSTGSLSLIARYIGEGNFSKASKYSGQLITLNIILSVFVTLFIFIFLDQILDYVGVKTELKDTSKDYLYVTIYGIPIMFFSVSIMFVLNAQGETTVSMLIVLIANLINFVLDPILIFYFNMGIAGAAWATLFSKFLTILIYYFLTYRLNRGIKISVSNLFPDFKSMKKIFNLGMPSTFSQVMTSISFLIFNSFVISISPKFLAGYGITNTIISFLFLPAVGIGSGLVSIVGQNLGARKINRIGDALKKGFFVSLVISILITLVVITNRSKILSFFTDDIEIIAYADNYLFFASISSIGYGLQQVFFGGLIGAGHTKLAMIIVFIRLWVIRLPIVIILQYFGIMENSVSYALVIANYSAFLILLFITLGRYWEKDNYDTRLEMPIENT